MAEGEEKNGILDSMPVFAKELIAGGVTGGIAKTAVAPLERIKILFQVWLWMIPPNFSVKS